MLQAPTNDRKTKADASAKTAEQLPEQEQARQLMSGMGRSHQSPMPQQRTNLAALQKSYGNQAVLRMKGRSPTANSIQGGVLQRKCDCGNSAGSSGSCAECQSKQDGVLQTKLQISEPGDRYEQEANLIADQVIQRSEPTLQYAGQENVVQTKAIANSISPLQHHSTRPDHLSEVPPIVHDVLNSSGQSLDSETRRFMEPRFGQDFSQVVVHINGEAAKAAGSVQARAYTIGNHIVFGAGEYTFATAKGKKLLAHELTHVVQQESASDGVIDEDQISDEENMVAVDGGNTRITRNIDLGSMLQRQGQSRMPRIKVVTNHQFSLTAGNVAAGLRSGNGGVSEMEVSNGSDNFNGQSVSEVFVGASGNNLQVGGCNNSHGQGGQSGSTFTIGTGVSFSRFGININLPAKNNTFYDTHIKAFTTNILPAGVSNQFSSCLQQYVMGGVTLNGGQNFNRVHNITRTSISGQDVANIDLVKS